MDGVTFLLRKKLYNTVFSVSGINTQPVSCSIYEMPAFNRRYKQIKMVVLYYRNNNFSCLF